MSRSDLLPIITPSIVLQPCSPVACERKHRLESGHWCCPVLVLGSGEADGRRLVQSHSNFLELEELDTVLKRGDATRLGVEELDRPAHRSHEYPL